MRRLHGLLDHFQWRIEGFTQGLAVRRVDYGNARSFGKHPLTVDEAAMAALQKCSNLRQDFNVAHTSPFDWMSA
ncbi:hypothetical protein D3C81_2293530 [compost metagenome]